jgi:hypothetical protein
MEWPLRFLYCISKLLACAVNEGKKESLMIHAKSMTTTFNIKSERFHFSIMTENFITLGEYFKRCNDWTPICVDNGLPADLCLHWSHG